MSFAALAVVACASSGCLVVSLEPIYTPATIQTDDPLLGSWEDTEDGSTAVVERGEWKSYRVTYTSGSTSLDLTAYETTIGDRTFLDLTPARGLESGPLMIPAHLACRLTRTGDRVIVTGLSYDWFTATSPRTLWGARHRLRQQKERGPGLRHRRHARVDPVTPGGDRRVRRAGLLHSPEVGLRSACVRSAIRSSGSSIPTDNRTRLSPMPMASLCAGVRSRCDAILG